MTVCVAHTVISFSWFDDDGHVRGHFNSWIFKINNSNIKIKSTFHWNLKFVECPTNKNDFTVSVLYCADLHLVVHVTPVLPVSPEFLTSRKLNRLSFCNKTEH